MPLTPEQIKQGAQKLADMGRSRETIEQFIRDAEAEQNAAAQTQPQTEAPAPKRPFGEPTMGERVAGVVFPPAAALSYTLRNASDPRTLPAGDTGGVPSSEAYTGMSEMGMGGLTAEEMMAGSRQGSAIAARGAPVVAAIAFPPSGLAGYLALAGIGGLGETTARAIEGKSLTSREGLGEAAKAAVLSGMPMGKIKAAYPAGNSFIQNVGRDVGQAVKMGAISGGTQAAAETTGRAVAGAEQYQSTGEALGDVAVPVAFGILTGGLSSRLGGIGARKEALRDRQKLLDDVGVKDPTAAMLDPSMAQWETRVANTSPELKERILKSQTDIAKNFFATMGEVESNATVADALRPLIAKVDSAEVNYARAQELAETAKKNFQRANEAVGLPENKRNELIAKASADVLNTIGAKARAVYEANAAVGDAVSNTAKAADLSRVVGDLYEARTAIGRQLYKDAGIPLAEGLFGKTEMIEAARLALGERADSIDGKRILDVIRNAGADPARPSLSLADLQSLRARMSDAFADKAADPRSLSIAEGLASRAYGALGETSRKVIAQSYPPEVAQRYGQAVDFWRETAKVSNSDLGRALLQRGQITDSTLGSLASGIVAGNVDELNQFKEFTTLLRGYRPEVADLAEQTMAGALKNAFVRKHTKAGVVNYPGLLDDLANAPKDLPFEIQNLGFGTRDTIKQWSAVAKDYKPAEVTDRVMESVLLNPEVRKAIEFGGADAGGVIRKVTAGEIYRDKVAAEVATRMADATKESRKAQQEALAFLKRAEIDEASAKKILEEVQNDPVLSAFSGKGRYNLTNETQKTGSGTVTHLIGNMPPAAAGSMMAALRQRDPQLAKLVEQRLLANELTSLAKVDPNTPGGERALKLADVRAFFNPIEQDRANSRLAFLENTVGKESLNRLKNLTTKLAVIDDDIRRGRFPTTPEMQSLVDAASLGAAGASGSRPAMFMAIFQRMRDAASRSAYNLLAAAITDPEIGRKVFDPAMNLSQALGSLPAQKAYLLTNDAALQEDIQKLDGLPNWQGRPSGRQ